MPQNHRKRHFSPIMERLEDRITPSVMESFDTTPVGQMPAGWSQWSSTGQTVFGASAAVALSPTHSLAANTSTDWVTSQAWLSSWQPNDVQVSAAVYLNSPMPLHLLARGSGLGSLTPTYYGVQIVPGLEAKIIRVQQGVITVLDCIDTVDTFSQGWVRITLTVSGTSLSAQLWRPDTGQYLAANGHWQSGATWVLSATDGTITSGSEVGLARTPSYQGSLYVDDFDVFPPTGDPQAPTVALTAPASGATLTGTTTVQAKASDNVGVAHVDFYLDWVLQASSSVAPYTWNFDSTAASNGTHQLTAVAYNVAGNKSQATVTVTTSNATALPVPWLPQHYSWIRVAQLGYSSAQLDSFGQNLLSHSVDLVVTPGGAMTTQVSAIAPNTTQLVYTNLTTLYGSLLTGWLNYASNNGYWEEDAFYHVAQATAYSGTSPSSQPVNWFWNVYRSGSSPRDLTVNSYGQSPGLYSAFGSAVGDAVYLGYPEQFREINLKMILGASGGWAAQLEYPTAVDANGNPTQWARLSRLGDDTNTAQTSGRIWYDPPADWKKISVNGSAPMYYVRFRTTSAGNAPVAASILGRDYTGANGGNSGVIPAFDWSADTDGDGYLNDAEYANRKAGMDARFAYESRAVFGSYGEERFATNPSNPSFRIWAVTYLTQLVQNQPSSVGLFVDNSEGDPPAMGGQVVEGTSSYTQDYASLLNDASRAIAPRLLMANTITPQVIRQSTGAFEEFALRPMSSTYDQFEATAALIAQEQALRSPSPYLVLDVLPEGGSPTDPRTQMASLAYYYLVGNPTTTFIDFFGGYETGSDWSRHWTQAAAYNVGQPQGTWSLFATGADPEDTSKTYRIYQRAYTNALVLYKPISLGNGNRGTLDDATATWQLLPGTYRQLNADGSLGPIITSITLRNGEGAVLIKAGGE
jgi:hypothetical protein